MRIILLSRGPSLHQCKDLIFSDDVELYDEIWGTNKTMFQYPVTLGFVMDDARARIKEYLDPDFYSLLQYAPVPFYTSRRYPELTMSMEYPLEMVYKQVGTLIHQTRTSIDWVLAYAYTTGVEEITFFGLDGVFADKDPSRHATTAGWLMLLKMKGCQLIFPRESLYSEFLDNAQGMYGYAGSKPEKPVPPNVRRETRQLLEQWRDMQ